MQLRNWVLLRGGILVLFWSAILYWIGFSMLRPMLALYFGDSGYSAPMIGLIMALNAIIPVMFAMPAGSVIDRIGSRNAVLFGSIVMALSGVLYLYGGMMQYLWPVLVGQLLNGVGSLLSWGALQASAAIASKDSELPGKKENLLPNFTFVNSLAQFSGPIIGGVLADTGSFLFVFAAFIGVAILSTGSAMLLPKLDKLSIRNKLSFRFWKSYGSGISLIQGNRMFKISLLLNAILFILVDIQSTFLPIYLATISLTNTQIGSILSVAGVASILIRPAVGYLLRMVGHQWIMIISISVGGICLTALAFHPAIWVILALVFTWGLCTGVNQPMALIMVAKSVASEQQGMGMSLRTMSNRIVQVVNPVVFGSMFGLVGITFGFGALGLVLIGLSAGMYGYLRPMLPVRSMHIPVKEQ
jgi:MFS family permease